MSKMTSGISREGMTPEWVAREGKMGDAIIQARIQTAYGNIEDALQLYAKAAAEEEALADYCEGIGLIQKAYYHWLSGANCWAKAGNLYRGIEIGEKILARDTLTPHQRRQIEELVERLRAERREWHALHQEREETQAQQRTEPRRSGETVAA